MLLYMKSFLVHVGAVGIIGCALFLLARSYEYGAQEIAVENTATSSVQSAIPQVVTESEPPEDEMPVEEIEELATSKPQIPVSETPAPSSTPDNESSPSDDDEIRRIKDPYPTPPLSFEVVNTEARAALVNIICSSTVRGVRSITASGIIIDPRGIILTNAHVAQYVLLSESPSTGLACAIRQGSPARSLWRPEILYIPPTWVEKHAEDVTRDRSTGTGEHDYALLRIKARMDGSPLPTSFPAVIPDTREGIGFLDDQVLNVSYPAEFLASTGAQFELYPLSTVTKIQELLTFYVGSVDLISVGSTAGAQGGSSGGAIVNAWGRLVGLITTTSEGETTAERDLRGLTMSYIDRDLVKQTGFNLSGILSGDVASKALDFKTNQAPALIELLLAQIVSHTN